MNNINSFNGISRMDVTDLTTTNVEPVTEIKETVKNSYDENLNPYTEIEKVQLQTPYAGSSGAFSVRLPEISDKEVGVVKESYLLVSNLDIHKVGQAIRDQSGLKWDHFKSFFDGKVFKNQFICKDDRLISKVPQVDDLIGLVMEEQNSYDSSLSAGINFSFLRLICTNGMSSKKFGFGHSFKHNQNNVDWENEIYQAVNLLNSSKPIQHLERFTRACGTLQKPISFSDLHSLTRSKSYLRNLPTQQYGQIVRNMFLAKESNGDKKYGNGVDYTAWDLFNSGTEILTHQKKLTQGAMRNNIILVDGMLNWGADQEDNDTLSRSYN